MTVVVQTNIPGTLHLWLVPHRQSIRHLTQPIVWHGSDRLLAFLDRSLRRQKTSVHKITGLVVVRGPGPFTAVRTGLIVANTLGSLLNIPVRGVTSTNVLTDQRVSRLTYRLPAKFRTVRPVYGKAPNITRPKRR